MTTGLLTIRESPPNVARKISISQQLSFTFEEKPDQLETQEIKPREILPQLLTMDLTWKGEKTNYATHNLHAFAAKFPPQLPKFFIEKLSRKGEAVLDPMCGSGTTLVEAILCGRRGIGVDLDPLALLITKVKTTHINLAYCRKIANGVLEKALHNFEKINEEEITHFYGKEALEFFQYWFTPTTIKELFSLIRAIGENVENQEVKDLLKATFSSCIITKTASLTLARDLAHSRPHRDLSKVIKQSAFEVFKKRLENVMDSLEDISSASGKACILKGDARELPSEANSIDLIVTSPPYASNAIDYMRAHKFSLIWLGFEPENLTKLRRNYIGSELLANDLNLDSATGQAILESLQDKDKKRALVVARYYHDMQKVLQEMLRVLKKGKAAILVVGSSIIKGIDIKVPTVLGELAHSIGFEVAGIAKRDILRNARMMPVSHKSDRQGIEARMHEEGVIGLIKPEKE